MPYTENDFPGSSAYQIFLTIFSSSIIINQIIYEGARSMKYSVIVYTHIFCLAPYTHTR